MHRSHEKMCQSNCNHHTRRQSETSIQNIGLLVITEYYDALGEIIYFPLSFSLKVNGIICSFLLDFTLW